MAATQTQPRSDAPTEPAPTAARSEIATMLPEPGQIGGAMSSGDADDLISKLADAQIDKLLADDEAGDATTTPAAPIQPIAFTPPAEEPAAAPIPSATGPADPIAAVENSIGAAAAVEAALPPAPTEAASESPAVEESAANGTLPDDAAAVAAELAADDRLHHRTPEPATTQPVAAEPAIVSETPPPVSATEPTPEEIAALREPLPGVAPFPVPTPDASPAEAPATHPTIGEIAAEAAAAEHADEDATPSAGSRYGAVVALPVMLLDAINYPVRNLSDKARESLGVVAIVTVVNAVGLIAYRAFVARH